MPIIGDDVKRLPCRQSMSLGDPGQVQKGGRAASLR